MHRVYVGIASYFGRSQSRGAYTKMRNIAYGVTALLTIAGAVVDLLLGGPVLLVFALTALALVGLAWVLGQATER